jgi:succinoglycan biosynthesis protein ExoO
VAVANRNGAAFLAFALDSILSQTLADLQVIISDDASTDRSLEIARQFARRDGRVEILTADRSGGAGAARNRALAAARARWIAIIDSDDHIHPERLRRLVETAERVDADIVADDLVLFHEDRSEAPRFLLKGDLARAPAWIGLARFIDSNRLFGASPALGYLKPLIRTETLRRTGVTYDEALPIGEDFDLLARLLAAGATLHTIPEPLYFYRRHGASTSHRLSLVQIEAMQDAHRRLEALAPERPPVVAALASRHRSLERAHAFTAMVDALKGGNLSAFARLATRNPTALPIFRLVLEGRIRRLLKRRAPQPAVQLTVLILSRQRVVGRTNGSSAYLLSIAAALKARGWSVRFIGPSPTAFGRWPALRLKPETDVFDVVRLRGSIPIGRWRIAVSPVTWARCAATVLEVLLAKSRIKPKGWIKPAPYAVAQPATRADLLYVAQNARAQATAIVADYAFLTPLIPYALNPDARTAVIMHDLFSARSARFAGAGETDSVAALDATREFELLGQAQAVIAIQAEEAEAVRARLPQHKVLLAPMAVEPVPEASPGNGRKLLFVGSNTAPNVVGLRWFFREVWPYLADDVTLDVVGNVSRAFDAAPKGVHLHGPVADLNPWYARAGIVIAPLTVGSGLKVKLMEALAAGKAVVGTSIMAQGVEALVANCAVIADDPALFARAILTLAGDDRHRRALGEAALACVRQEFSPATAYGPVVAWLEEGARRGPDGLSGGGRSRRRTRLRSTRFKPKNVE